MILSIIIPIHNRIHTTKEGLSSLYDAINYYNDKEIIDKLEITVIVVDDGSNDGSALFIINKYPQIVLLKGNGNLWWSGGINKGVKFAINRLKSSYILLWNNDIIPDIQYFVNLDQKIKNNKKCIIGSYIYDNNTNLIWSKGGRFNILTGKRSMLPERINKNKYTYDWLPGMGTTIPKYVFEEIGYWDNINFPQYHGDFDYTIRASKKGIRIIVDESLKLFNKTELSSFKGKDFKTFYQSLKRNNLGSRYNLYKDIKIYRRHCIGPFWIIFLLKKYLIYSMQTLKIKQ